MKCMAIKKRAWMFLALLLTLSSGAFAARNPVDITDGPRVEYTSANSAIIAWSTNAPSSSVVRYGANGRLDQTARAPYTSGTHRVTIRGLNPGTTYSFVVDSGQAMGTGTNVRSGMMTFSTRGAGNYGGNYRGAPYGATSSAFPRRDVDRDHDFDNDASRPNQPHDNGKHKGWYKSKNKVRDKDKDKDKDHDADRDRDNKK